MQLIEHDPQAVLDYSFDFAVPNMRGETWLGGDTIADATVTCADVTVTVSGVVHDDTKVTCWVTGGTLGMVGLRCHILTLAGREDDRTLWMTIKQR